VLQVLLQREYSFGLCKHVGDVRGPSSSKYNTMLGD
jgi:hypothetical protein